MVSTDIGIWIAAFFTISIMSYAFKDNVVFKFAEKTFVAAVIGNAVVMGWDSLKQFGFNKIQGGEILYIIPILLGVSIFMRYHPKYYWLSRYGTALLVGVGTGLTLRTVTQSNITEQIITTITPGETLIWIFTAVTTFTIITHFTFTIKQVHDGPIKSIPEIGRYLMLIAFGAAFGNTVMTRMNLLVGRLIFLLKDWLALM